MVVSRSGRIAVTVGLALLASTLQHSPARAVDSLIDQEGHHQVTAPGADAKQSVLATTPVGLVEAYLQGTALFVRRHTDGTGWGPSTFVASDQLSDGSDVQAVAGTATRSFVVSEFLENGVERFRISTYADDGTFIAGAGPGTGVAPKITAFADGSAVLTVLNEDGTEVHAWNVTSEGLMLNDTVLASSLNGVDDPDVVADKDGLPLVLWEQCADAGCSTTDIRSSTRTDAVTWAAPTTVLAGTQAVGLAAGSGGGKILLNWLDEDAATGEIVSLALEQRGGAWGSPMEVGTFGYPMISPSGDEIIGDADGYRSLRRDSDSTWTDDRIGLGREQYCDAGGVPALEDHTYFLHEAIEDPAAPDTCRIIETRDRDSNGDFFPPVLQITSYPSYRSGPSKQTVTFSSDSAVATLCQLDARPFTTCTSPISYTGVQTGLHTFHVAGVDAAGNWSEYVSQSWQVDATAPTVSVSAPAAPLSLNKVIVAAWRGTDVGVSGRASYDVRINKAPAGAGFSPWSTIATATLGTGTTLTGYPGYTTCVQVRGKDHAGNMGAWSPQRCTALPVDDRSLSASAGWSRGSGSPYFAKTITSTTKLGATLVSPTLQTTRLGLVATKCPSCGAVGVYVGSTLLARVNLTAPRTSYANIISLPRISLRTTKVTVRVLTSGKPVQIDGLHSSRV